MNSVPKKVCPSINSHSLRMRPYLEIRSLWIYLRIWRWDHYGFRGALSPLTGIHTREKGGGFEIQRHREKEAMLKSMWRQRQWLELYFNTYKARIANQGLPEPLEARREACKRFSLRTPKGQNYEMMFHLYKATTFKAIYYGSPWKLTHWHVSAHYLVFCLLSHMLITTEVTGSVYLQLVFIPKMVSNVTQMSFELVFTASWWG